jgi:hypothetical protein
MLNSAWDRLRGGDLRSIGAADEVAALAVQEAALFEDLVAGLDASDPVLRMRCADALEKASRTCPDRLQPHAGRLRALLAPDQPKEILWHTLQMLSRVQWRAREVPGLLLAVEACLASSSSIVRTCAMQSLVDLARSFPEHRGRVEPLIRELSRSGTPAMRSRGVRLLQRLARAQAPDPPHSAHPPRSTP